jgi:hypothetical protein
MEKLGLILLVFAFVCFVIAAWGTSQPHYGRLIAAGLAFLSAAFIFGGVIHLFA